MHPLDDRVRAEHMLIAAKDASIMIAGRVRADLDSDAMLRRAVVNAIQEVGEAASRISDLGRQRLPGLPWEKVVGMRNRLVHGYDTINLNTVWTVANEEVPALIAALESAFKSWPLPEPPKK